MAIDLNLAAQSYATNTPASAGKWATKAAQNANKWEQNAKSPQAEQAYAEGVQLAVQNQLRAKGLANVSASEWAAGIQQGQQAFAQKTSQKSGKWATNFAPSAAIIDRIVPSLPPRVPGQPVQNWVNRGGPIATALNQAKLAGATRGGSFTSRPAPFGGGLQF